MEDLRKFLQRRTKESYTEFREDSIQLRKKWKRIFIILLAFLIPLTIAALLIFGWIAWPLVVVTAIIGGSILTLHHQQKQWEQMDQ